MCGAVLRCAIISLSNFLFSIAWLIWLQRLGHNYSTFYSHSVFHQSYFLDYFDSGTIIIWNSLKNDMDEVNLSVYLLYLHSTLQLAIYPNAESTNGDIQVKVSSVWQRREMWSCEGHNSGAVAESLYSVCKHTFTWTWSNQCNCRYQTARNNHVETNISISISIKSI